MVDITLLADQLRDRGFTVEYIHPVPDNAGVWEMTIDGKAMNLEQARELLARDEGQAGPVAGQA